MRCVCRYNCHCCHTFCLLFFFALKTNYLPSCLQKGRVTTLKFWNVFMFVSTITFDYRVIERFQFTRNAMLLILFDHTDVNLTQQNCISKPNCSTWIYLCLGEQLGHHSRLFFCCTLGLLLFRCLPLILDEFPSV